MQHISATFFAEKPKKDAASCFFNTVP
jgi:hypothetical protein